MADVRQNISILDDFNRADEVPLSGGGNWAAITVAGASPLELDNNMAEPGGGGSRQSYWTPLTMDNDDCEVWAEPFGGGAPSLAWGIGFYRDAGTATADGYLFRSETSTSGPKWNIYRCDNGSFSVIATSGGFGTGSLSAGGSGKMCLIRRNGNDIEGWYDGTADGVYDAFTLQLSVTDTNYMTGMYPVLELFGSDILGWDNFGAGPAADFMPDITRRTFGSIR